MKVKITSPCMAMLVYEAAKSLGQSQGTLYGELSTETTKNITDSDVTITTEDILSIHALGKLNLNNIHAVKEDDTTQVFGWFKFSRRPSLRLTVHEKSIHRKLINKLNESHHSSEGSAAHVVTILIQEKWSENQSLYLWKFAAFAMRDKWFVPCRMEIVNLKATTCGAYKPYSSIHQHNRLPQVTKVLSSLKDSFITSNNDYSFHMVEAVRDTGQKMVGTLNDTLDKLRSTESELQAEYDEQMKLKQRLVELQGGETSASDVDNEAENLVNETDLSEDSDTSESSNSAEYCREAKEQEDSSFAENEPDFTDGKPGLYRYNKWGNNILDPSSIGDGNEEEEINHKLAQESDPPPPYEAFDNLADPSPKEESQKSPHNNSPLTSQYNDDQLWGDGASIDERKCVEDG